MKNFYIVFLLLFTMSLNAQQNNCGSEKYNEFDFWIGSWEVFDEKGKLLGTNTITKKYDNCVLTESWVSSGKNKGTSINFYNRNDNSWNQIWVDNSGYTLSLKGKLENGVMVLKSDIQKNKKGNYYNQISWTLNNDESVTQLWEVFSEKHVKISEAFKGIYKKKLN